MARAMPCTQELRHEREQGLQRVKLHGLPGDNMFDSAGDMPPLDVGVRVKLHDKRTVHGQLG
jgi:hypothetical protein